MPRPSNCNNNGQKKKKKGHAPAHQNSFAFKHNPKSKKTDAILALPIHSCCRRCKEKLEWRKKYRKFKPRTVAGKCNHCQRPRVVKAAYHTICKSCSQHSEKSKLLLKEFNSKSNTEDTDADSDDQGIIYHRICCVCAKEPSLFDPDTADKNNDKEEPSNRRIRLRERKALERQREREANNETKEKAAASREEPQVNYDEAEEEYSQGDGDDDRASSLSESESLQDCDDPFLKAIGGADKLLVGEAYQQKLLSQQLVQNVD